MKKQTSKQSKKQQQTKTHTRIVRRFAKPTPKMIEAMSDLKKKPSFLDVVATNSWLLFVVFIVCMAIAAGVLLDAVASKSVQQQPLTQEQQLIVLFSKAQVAYVEGLQIMAPYIDVKTLEQDTESFELLRENLLVQQSLYQNITILLEQNPKLLAMIDNELYVKDE